MEAKIRKLTWSDGWTPIFDEDFGAPNGTSLYICLDEGTSLRSSKRNSQPSDVSVRRQRYNYCHLFASTVNRWSSEILTKKNPTTTEGTR